MSKKGVIRGYKGGKIIKKNSLRGVRKDRKFKKGKMVGGNKKKLAVSRETLDKEIETFMQSR